MELAGRLEAFVVHPRQLTDTTAAPAPPLLQGLWQELLTGWLGGSRDPLLLTDPSAIESGMRASMGSLVGSPVLPAFLLLPAAAVLTGVVEGGNYYLAMALRDTTV